MCGIFGYYHYNAPTTISKIVDLTLDGLKRLEYRGYDSAGICINDKKGTSVILKSVGNVSNLKETLQRNGSVKNIITEAVHNGSSIAHTRWATHGPPSDVNAHPHASDEDINFAVVHNGIISNFGKVKEFLNDNGYSFESLTDTEVVPKLCKYFYDQNSYHDFEDIVMKTIKMLEGTFALLIKSSLYPTELLACKKGSPLIVGQMKLLDGNEYVFSSDMSAIIDHTNTIITLDDYEIMHVKNGLYKIYNYELDLETTRIPTVVNMNKNDILIGNYTTYMEKEILEQPITLKKTMYGRYFEDSISIDELKPYKHRFSMASKLLLVACGTSFNACLGSRMMLEQTLNIPVYVEYASDFMDRSYCLKPIDICVFVSQSGETADTLYALQYARKHNAFTVAITNKPDSTIASNANVCINLNAGFEISVASTKAYTSQLVMFAMIAAELTNEPGNHLRINTIPDMVQQTIDATTAQIEKLTCKVVKYKSILCIGRGSNYATALESALKVKEIAYIHSEGIMAGELKHGPLALLDHNVLTFVFVTQDSMYNKMISVVEQLKARNANIIVVSNTGDDVIAKLITEENRIEVPRVHNHMQHIINVIPMQLLAYNLAKIQGHNVDQPRNLAKSVTVSD